MSMGTQFVSTSGAIATSTSAKTIIALVAGATSSPALIGFDFSSDGTVTTGQYLVEITKFTTGGTSAGVTPFKIGGTSSVVSTTSTYSAEPTSPTVVASLYVPALQAYSYLYPLGREISLALSTMLALRVTAPSGTPNVRVNLYFEE